MTPQTKTMKVPVILLNYNSSADCRKCISDLKRQEGVSLEIIIVDNCSREDDTLAVKELAEEQGCTFISAKENRGYNAGNNIGLRYAAEKGYGYALIANPDMEFPQKDYVFRLVSELQQRPEVAVVGSDIVTPEGIHQNPRKYDDLKWTGSFDWIATVFMRKNDTNRIPEWIENPYESHECRGLNGCCFLIRMDFAIHIGFFDENVFLYGEEPILAQQVVMSGLKMLYLSSPKAIHNHIKSKEPTSAFCLKHWKHSRMHYIKKYGHYPWYGKWIALVSQHLYFLSLSLSHIIKRRRNG